MRKYQKNLSRKKTKRRASSRHVRALQFLETIDFTVRPKKSTLTATKFDDWLWGASERSFLYPDEQERFFRQFKYYPWTLITHPKYLSRWLAYVRGGLGRNWVRSGLSTPYRATVRLKGRWMYRLHELMKHKPRQASHPLTQTPYFRKLFRLGFLANQADDFFLHRRASRTTWVGGELLLIRYNVVVSDILRYRTWSLRRFFIRPILMRKLLASYVGAEQKQVGRFLRAARAAKKSQLETLMAMFRYCLVSIIYRGFRTLGLATAFILVRNRLVWVNGECAANPFQPCHSGDLVQLDVFSLLRPPKRDELYPRFVKTFVEGGHAVSGNRRRRLSLIATLLSTFKNPILLRPGRVGGPQYRYSKGSFLIYGWGLVAPELGSWVARQIVASVDFFFDDMKRHNKMCFTGHEISEAEFLGRVPHGALTSPQQDRSYALLMQKFNFLHSYPIFLDFDRVFGDDDQLPPATGGEAWLGKAFVHNHTLASSLRLKPFSNFILTKHEYQTGESKSNSGLGEGWRLRELGPAGQVRRGVVDQLVRRQNLQVLRKTRAAQRRGLRALPGRSLDSSLIPDKSIFSVALISKALSRPGRKHFLNKHNLRFLLAFK